MLMMRERFTLDGEWTFAWGEEDQTEKMRTGRQVSLLPCSVPGNFELDLLRHGVIEDPYVKNNVVKVNAFTQKQFVLYVKRFTFNKTDKRHFLNFEGVDCFAEVWLNGEKAASLSNMNVHYQIDVTELLRHGGGGTGAAEKVNYKITLVRRCLYYPL